MRGRTVLTLLIVVVGLVAFIELYEHELPSSEERAATEKLVLNADARAVVAIDLDWGGNQVRLRRDPSEAQIEDEEIEDLAQFSWRLTEPFSGPADVALVASLIESLATLEKRRNLDDSRLDDLGLDPPRLRVRLHTANDDFELLVGSAVPAGNSMIVSAVSSGEIVVVDDSLWPELTREPGDWRRREVFDVGQESVEGLTLQHGDQRLVFTRRGEDFWLESPVDDLVEAEKIGSLLAALASLRVKSFGDDWVQPGPDLGLDPPVGEVELKLSGDGDALKLDWGLKVVGTEAEHYARVESQGFTTEAELQEFFETPIDAWRSLDLTSFETFQIDALEILEPGEGAMSLERDGANWARGEDEISFTVVSDLLYSVSGARAASLGVGQGGDSLAIVPFEPDLELVLRGGGRVQTLRFQSRGGEGPKVVVADREVVLFLGQDEFTEILVNVRRVRAEKGMKSADDEQLLP